MASWIRAGVGLAKTALSESTQGDVDDLRTFFDCARRIWGLRKLWRRSVIIKG